MYKDVCCFAITRLTSWTIGNLIWDFQLIVLEVAVLDEIKSIRKHCLYFNLIFFYTQLSGWFFKKEVC